MQNFDREKLPDNLALFRKKAGYSQLQLADKLGYSNKNISKWEKGETVPDVFVLRTLCEIYGITLDEFFDGPKPSQEDLLEKEISENVKLRAKMKYLSLIIASLFFATCSAVASVTVLSLSPDSKFAFLPYLYSIAIICFLFYLFFKPKKALFGVLFLLGFVLAFYFSIYFTFSSISPWIFILSLPTFFLIYFSLNLYNVGMRYVNARKKHKNKTKE